jgi:hypothetical protein
MENETVTIEKPGELLKTKIISLDHESNFEELDKLSTYEQVQKASESMHHGEIRGMLNRCRVQDGGAVAPWQLKRLFGTIPLPWLSALAILMMFIGVARGGPTDLAVIGSILLILGMVASSFWLAEYKFDQPGMCLIGGEPVAKEWKKSIEVYDHKGRQKQISQSGYCDQHARNVHRLTLWSIVEAQVWRGIIESPIKRPNLLRKIGYGLFWWVGYQEQFVDPRPVAQGLIYLRKDRTRPRDQLNENVMDNTIAIMFMAIENMQRLKRTRRKL